MMGVCKSCENSYCHYIKTDTGQTLACSGYVEAKKPMTNADRIRKMNDDWLKNVILCPLEFSGLVECPDVPNCTTCKQYWLQQPAEVE